jgi:hypothetical protein
MCISPSWFQRNVCLILLRLAKIDRCEQLTSSLDLKRAELGNSKGLLFLKTTMPCTRLFFLRQLNQVRYLSICTRCRVLHDKPINRIYLVLLKALLL